MSEVKKIFSSCKTLEEAVYQAIGTASMCWEDLSYAGAFDEEQAKLVAQALLFKIRSWIDDVARTIMDGPGAMPETVRAEDIRLREERYNAK